MPQGSLLLHLYFAGCGDSFAQTFSVGTLSSVIASSGIFEAGIDICLLSPERALQPVSKHPLAGGFGERALGVCPL